MRQLSGPVLLLAVLSTLAVELGAPRFWDWATLGALIVFLLLVWPRTRRSGRAFIWLCLGLSTYALWSGAVSPGDLRGAIHRVGFICALFTAFGMLREAAATSGVVRRCGLFLSRRKPGWRYLALNLGGQLFGIILNFGVIPLLGAMVTEGTREADTPEKDADRAKRAAVKRLRMIQAVNRGFSTTLSWSPLTVSQAVILTALPGMTWEEEVPWLLILAAAFTLVGWTLDRIARARFKVGPPLPATGEEEEDGSWALVLPILALVIGLMGLGLGLSRILEARLVVSVMLMIPLVAAGWLFTQSRTDLGLGGALAETGHRLGLHVRDTFPAYHHELAIVGSAAFLGVIVSAFIPVDRIVDLLTHLNMPAWVPLAIVPWLALLGGQLGMSPVLSVTLLAAAMPAPEVLGLPATVMAVAYAGGWCLVAASSPFTASVLISSSIAHSKVIRITPLDFGLRYNGAFVLVCGLLLSAYVAFLARTMT
ncbi:MAG: hypothetical protein K9H25_19365 [Rhodospirillum sp.]|nr:hypothetical protein [Rhodospirillum sp.]MCF8489684.1 hypothetical protein [Rhodospirillum sp.]MCF8502290.1 hypothetical protein [Rhodospirillum sp.]